MKNFIIALLIASPASLFAVDWTSIEFTLVDSQKVSSEVTTDIVKDKDGNQITITYTGEIPENYMGIVKKLNNDFRTWSSMKVENITFSIINHEIQILVSPKEYTYKDDNIMDHISSGILFTFRGNLLYNFRILVDKLFVPIKGIFIDEVTFNEKILSAIKDPTTYINARDPEYLLERLEKLTLDVDRMRAAYLASMNFNQLISKEIIEEVIEIKSKNPAYTYKEIYKEMKEKNKDVKTSPDIIRNILKVYYNEF